MKRWILLSAIGSDRPGLVAELARLIYDCGANLEDSRMTILGTDFAVILLCSAAAPDAADRIAVGAKRLERDHGLTILLRSLDGERASARAGPGNAALPARGGGRGPRGHRRRPVPRARRPRRQHRRALDATAARDPAARPTTRCRCAIEVPDTRRPPRAARRARARSRSTRDRRGDDAGVSLPDSRLSTPARCELACARFKPLASGSTGQETGGPRRWKKLSRKR